MLLYLLHFDRPVSGKQHYCGSCEDAEIDRRLRRHQLGTGSRLTSRVHKAGVGFSLAMLKQITNRHAEKKWKQAKRYRQDCTICASQGAIPDLFPNVLHFDPVAICNPQELSCAGGMTISFD